VGVGTWIGSGEDVSAVAATDQRPRAPAGEPRLIMDDRLDQFSERVAARARAGASPARSGDPAPASTPPKRNPQSNTKAG
jgi:hypothetical protein